MKSEINNNKISRKIPNVWKLNNIPLKSSQVKNENFFKNKKYFEPKGNKNKAYQNLQDAAKTVVVRKLKT